MYTAILGTVVVVLGCMSLIQLFAWQRADSIVVRLFTPAEGVYAAPQASFALGQWAVFAFFCCCLFGLLGELGAPAWVAFPMLLSGFVLGGIGTIVWLLMPDNFLVPKALRGAPGYLEVRGL